MARYLVNDANRKDERAKLTAEKIAILSKEIIAPKKTFIEYVSTGTLKIMSGTIITVNESIFMLDSEKTLTAIDLDVESSFQDGKDYYVYCCDKGGKDDEEYKISLNSTFPTGYTADNSRKIGGFHYGVCRKISNNLNPVGTDGTEWSSGWESNTTLDILNFSVWTTQHRPKSEPEGMSYIGNGLWADIYQSSGPSTKLVSVKGVNPVTGSEGFNWYLFNEALSRIGKRMLSFDEWYKSAHGSPRGESNNTMAWTAGSNTSRTFTGKITNAVSVFGLKDCVGNVNEWLSNLIVRPTETGGWGWKNSQSTNYSGKIVNKGSLYNYYNDGLAAILAGGHWTYSANAGPSCVITSSYPWNVHSSFGLRGASDSL
ncbi:MAG: hypothetical protein ACRCYT_00695 [Cetobacterium sp.]